MEKVYFEELKVRHEDYFVTYRPASPPFDFASLSLTFLSPRANDAVLAALECELQIWLRRYPVPIMATAFDDTDSVISLADNIFENGLVGWIDPASGEIASSQKLSELSNFTKSHPLPENLRNIYFDVPFETERQRKEKIAQSITKTRKNVQATKIIVLFWFVVVPAGVALFEYFGPGWLGTVVLVYSMWKAVQEGRKLTGRKKPSEREKEEAEKKTKSEHYFYHCEKNPKGFLRLKLENFEEEARSRTRKEAAEISNI
jgi:hypothetical protein